MLLYQQNTNTSDSRHIDTKWASLLIEQLAKRFLEPAGETNGFPCIFAQKAFALQSFKFLFIDYNSTRHEYDYPKLYEGLSKYLADSREWNGKFSSAHPLLVFFQPISEINKTSDFEQIFVQSLEYLIEHDSQQWDGKVPQDPDADFWTMCFNGVQIFINVSHPNHKLRRSRNLCDALTFVINPRERFDVFAPNTKEGYSLREKIRENIDIYDKIPRSPLLGHYLDGDLEWPQYMLPEDNVSPPLQCPLKFKSKN